MDTLSYTITREDLNSGNYSAFTAAANESDHPEYSSDILLSVIFNILNPKEAGANEQS